MKKNTIAGSPLILIFLLCSHPCFSQKNSRLSLKLGVSKNSRLFERNSMGYVSTILPVVTPYPTVGLEYSIPYPVASPALRIGATFDIYGFQTGVNEKNLAYYSGGQTLKAAIATIKCYAALERKFSAKQKPVYKNYFSWMAGAGISYNFLNGDSPELGNSGAGMTRDGREYKGIFRRDTFLGDGYYDEVYLRRASLFSPVMMAGLRWYIVNTKGNDAVVIELQANCGVTRYYNYQIDYTLDNVRQSDRIGERGFSVQLNFFIPLIYFKSKRK